jgi:hypothetical protein
MLSLSVCQTGFTAKVQRIRQRLDPIKRSRALAPFEAPDSAKRGQ